MKHSFIQKYNTGLIEQNWCSLAMMCDKKDFFSISLYFFLLFTYSLCYNLIRYKIWQKKNTFFKNDQFECQMFGFLMINLLSFIFKVVFFFKEMRNEQKCVLKARESKIKMALFRWLYTSTAQSESQHKQCVFVCDVCT